MLGAVGVADGSRPIGSHAQGRAPWPHTGGPAGRPEEGNCPWDLEGGELRERAAGSPSAGGKELLLRREQ